MDLNVVYNAQFEKNELTDTSVILKNHYTICSCLNQVIMVDFEGTAAL